jgi:hypothetical protein
LNLRNGAVSFLISTHKEFNGNNRPTQPLKDRTLVYDVVGENGAGRITKKTAAELSATELQSKGANHEERPDNNIRYRVRYRHVGGSACAGIRSLQKVRPGI